MLAKRLIFLSLPLVLGAVLTTACDSTTTTTPTPVKTSSFVMTWGTLAFPTTGVGLTSTTSVVVTLWNNGTDPVPVTSVTNSNAAEFPTSTTCKVSGVLPANSTCTVTTQFAPNALGAQTATLAINANSVAQPPLSLTGTGANINPRVTISAAGDAAPFVYTFAVTGATPGGTLTLQTIYTPAPGNPPQTFAVTSWIADASGNATASLTTDSPGTYENWLVDVTSGLSTNHVFHSVP